MIPGSGRHAVRAAKWVLGCRATLGVVLRSRPLCISYFVILEDRGPINAAFSQTGNLEQWKVEHSRPLQVVISHKSLGPPQLTPDTFSESSCSTDFAWMQVAYVQGAARGMAPFGVLTLIGGRLYPQHVLPLFPP